MHAREHQKTEGYKVLINYCNVKKKNYVIKLYSHGNLHPFSLILPHQPYTRMWETYSLTSKQEHE